MWIYLNGRMVEDAEARISVMDRGFLYGDGVFETVRIHHGRPVWLDRHLARLAHSCRAIHLDGALPAVDWPEVFQQVIDRNRLDHALIRLTVSRGVGEPGGGDGGDDDGVGAGAAGAGVALGDGDARLAASRVEPTVVLMPRALPHLTAQQRRDGVPVIITTIRRPSPLSGPTHAKTLNYLNSVLARHEAAARGAFEGLQLTPDGYLAEGAMSNIFFVTRKTLHTPSPACGILPGVTRAMALEIAPALGLGLRVREGRYRPGALNNADACFLTGSGIGILPVAAIDGKPLPPPSPDSPVAALQRRYERMMEEER